MNLVNLVNLPPRLGRRQCFLVGLVETCVAGVASSFAPTLPAYCVLVFLMAMGQVRLRSPVLGRYHRGFAKYFRV